MELRTRLYLLPRGDPSLESLGRSLDDELLQLTSKPSYREHARQEEHTQVTRGLVSNLILEADLLLALAGMDQLLVPKHQKP